jgi:DNA-binding beta-propeller fold protein YncE
MRARFFPFGVAFSLALLPVAAAFASDAPVGPASSAAAAAAGKGVASPTALSPLPDAVSAPMALARYQGGKTIAIVADEDDSSLHVFDVGSANPREISVVKLSGKPGHVAVAPDGRVFVAIRDKGSVSVFEASWDPKSVALVERTSINTGGEPIGLGVSPETNTLFVSSGWSGEVFAHSLAAPYARAQRFEVSREPRTIAVSKNGHNAFVSHGVGGTMSVVSYAKDTKTFSTKELDLHGRAAVGRVSPLSAAAGATGGGGRLAFSVSSSAAAEFDRPSTQGYAMTKHEGRIYAPETFVDPEKPTTYYGDGNDSFGIMIIDESTASVVETSRDLAVGSSTADSKCYLPRAAAFDPDRRRILVGCAGSDDLLDFDSLLANPAQILKRRIRTDDSPSSIAIDSARRVAVVWSQMGHTLSVIPLDKEWSDTKTRPTAVAHASSRAVLDVGIAHGRRIFHSNDGKVALDGRACASCHPDGRDDGIAWKTPDGPRQTAMLAGRVHDTAPYGWTRAQPTLKAYIADTITRLNGKGLSEPEMRDLVSYVKSLDGPPKGATPTVDVALATRGRELFDSSAVGCAACHSGGTRTDGAKHNIGSATATDKERAFETPSLRFVARTAPYFHDGRYKSLKDLLVAESGKMGNVKQLSESDQNALLAYVTSL